jgi:hypothetical protein
MVRGLIGHRMQRERQILKLVGERPRDIPDIVANAYPGLDPRLVPAAADRSLAHLLDLERRGLVEARGRDMESRLNKPLAIAAIVVALLLGVLVGGATGIADRLFGGPIPKTIASSSLESMRAQNRLVAVRRALCVGGQQRQERFGFGRPSGR